MLKKFIKKDVRRKWYKNGNIKSQAVYVNDKKHGEERLYYQNTQP
jgi:antitoxin component YwqK of YwqJK toxin-antitoxin module